MEGNLMLAPLQSVPSFGSPAAQKPKAGWHCPSTSLASMSSPWSAWCAMPSTTDKVSTLSGQLVLHTLTGEQPRVEYPILPVETKDTPKPKL
jgi:hypothetical protein